MSSIDKLLRNNASHAQAFKGGSLSAQPALRIAVVTCMDARVRAEEMLGFERGDAHVIRNAGGLVTEDTIRSLAVSQLLGRTDEIVVIHHTDCALMSASEGSVQALFREQTGRPAPFSFGAFVDLDGDVRESIRRIRASPNVPHRDQVRGFVYDIGTGLLREVQDRDVASQVVEG